MLGVSFLTFALMYYFSPDVVFNMFELKGMAVSDQVVAAERSKRYLDEPFFVQYLLWLKNILTGNFGVSFVSGDSVLAAFVQKLPNTILLSLFSLFLTWIIALPLGIIAALNKNKVIDYLIRGMTFILNATPGFVLSYFLLYLFAVKYNIFPILSITNQTSGTLFLPSLSLALTMSGKYIRQVRLTTLAELDKNYVIGAQSRGVPTVKILQQQVLKRVGFILLPLILLSLQSLLGGTAIIETIFLWDGIGKLLTDAILIADYPITQICVLWMVLITIVIRLGSSLLNHFLNPGLKLKDNV